MNRCTVVLRIEDVQRSTNLKEENLVGEKNNERERERERERGVGE